MRPHQIEFEDGTTFVAPPSWPAGRHRKVVGLDDSGRPLCLFDGDYQWMSPCCGGLVGGDDGYVCSVCQLEVVERSENPTSVLCSTVRMARTTTFKSIPGVVSIEPGENGLHTYEFIGCIFRLGHVTVVPFERRNSSHNCVVVESCNPSYPVGGYNIIVGDDELREAPVVAVIRPSVGGRHPADSCMTPTR